MKSKSKKIVTILLCITLLIGFIIPNYSSIIYATNTTTAQQQEETLAESLFSAGNLIDGIAGIITWPLRALVVAFGEVVRLIIGGVAAIAGSDSIVDNLDIRTRNNLI